MIRCSEMMNNTFTVVYGVQGGATYWRQTC